MRIIVSYSGGLTSYEAGRRAMALHGSDSVEWWFCDTLSEDPDLYRFTRDIEKLHGIKVRRLVAKELTESQDSTPGAALWDLFDSQGMIANTRADFCSRIAKRDLFRDTLADECDADDTMIVIGMDEIHDCDRIKRTRSYFKAYGWDTWFPLTEDPIVFKDEIAAGLAAHGIDQPMLYDIGAPHNNCGGFCVKAGMGQFSWLLKEMPDRYAYHERREQEFRSRTGKDVSILRDRRGGQTRPLTLERLRERIEAGERFKMKESSSCSCFSPQLELFDAS